MLRRWLPFVALALLFGHIPLAAGGEVTLKDGFVIDGMPKRVTSLNIEAYRGSETDVPNYLITMID